MEEKKKKNGLLEKTKKASTDTEDMEITKEQLEQVSGAGRPPQHKPPISDEWEKQK